MSGYVPHADYRRLASEWTGDIPTHWGIKRGKIIFAEVSDKGYSDEQLLSVTQEHGVYPRDKLENRVVMPMGELLAFKLIKQGDFAISLRSFQGGLEHSNYRGLVSPAYTVLRRKTEIEEYYFRYLLKSSGYVDALDTAVTGIREGKNIAYKDFAEINLPLPPLPEQRAIVSFLDAKLAQIDRFTANKRRLIELLQEQKQVIVNRYVTRGLDEGAALKDSGLEWLGRVPVGWEIIPIKHLFQEIDRRSTDGSEELLSLRMYQGLVPHNSVSEVKSDSSKLIGYKRVLPGEMVMNRMRASIGLFAVAKTEGLVSPDYALFSIDSRRVHPPYFELLFKNQSLGSVFRMESRGLGDGTAGFLRLYTDRFGKIKVILPSLSEQRAIVARIEQETSVIARAVAQAEREIELIGEYRTTLISDAVTGKIDVRAWGETGGEGQA